MQSLSEIRKRMWAEGVYAGVDHAARGQKISATKKAQAAADPEGFGERVRKAQRFAVLAQTVKRTASEGRVREFAALRPRPPWKVLATQLGVDVQTVYNWRKRLGLETKKAPGEGRLGEE